MKAYRYCEGCGIGFSKNQWLRSNHCTQCGSSIFKEDLLFENSADPQSDPSMEIMDHKVPSKLAKPLSAVGQAVSTHPLLCSSGAIGVGAGALLAAPLVMAAGQSIMVVGGLIAGVSWLLGSDSYDPAFEDGMKLGVKIMGVGALVFGSSYLLLGVGGLSVVAGVGLGGFTGAKAITKAVKERRKLVKGDNLMEEVQGELPSRIIHRS